MGNDSRAKKERRQHRKQRSVGQGQSVNAPLLGSYSVETALPVLDAASISPGSAHCGATLALLFRDALRRGGGRSPTRASDLSTLVNRARRSFPEWRMVEDFTPYDPRLPVLARWGDRVFRIVGGSLERPTAHIARLWTIAQCIDRVLLSQLGFGLFDVVELVLSRVDAVASEVAPYWDQAALASPGQSPTLPDEAPIAAAQAPGFAQLASRCRHPERALAALDYFTSTDATEGSPFDPLGTFGPIIASRGILDRDVALPTAFLMESLLAIPDHLVKVAVDLDPSLDERYGALIRRRLTRLLVGAGYRLGGQLKVGDEFLYGAVFISDNQVAILDVAAGLTNETVSSKVVRGGRALVGIRAGSQLETSTGPIEIPGDAQVVRAIVTTGYGATEEPSVPILSDSDLEWIIRDRVETPQDLWYFLRDLHSAPGVTAIFAADVIDKFEVWKQSRSFHNGGSPLGFMMMQPHAAVAEWEYAAAAASTELALQRLQFPPLRDWPTVVLDDDEVGGEIADLHDGAAWQILPWDIPVAVQKSGSNTPRDLAETFFRLGHSVVWKLRQCRAELEAGARRSEVDSVRIAFQYDPTPIADAPGKSPIVAGDTSNGAVSIVVRQGINEALVADSRSVEAEIGRAISTVFDTAVQTRFLDAWLTSSPGIRIDVMNVPQSARGLGPPTETDGALISEAEAEFARYLAQISQPTGLYVGAAAAEFESRVAFPWLLNHFHEEVGHLSAQSLLSRAQTELERVNCDQIVRAQKVAWERGFPTNDDVNWVERMEEGTQLRRTIEFIIEETLARPPDGAVDVGDFQWRRCLASAYVCVESFTRSDAIHRKLMPTSVEVSAGYEVHIFETGPATDVDLVGYMDARKQSQLPTGVPISSGAEATPPDAALMAAAPSRVGDRMPQMLALDDTLRTHLGFGVDAFLTILETAKGWPVSDADPVVRVDADTVARAAVDANPVLDQGEAVAALNWMTLRGGDLDGDDIPHWEVEQRRHRVRTSPFIEWDDRVAILPWSSTAAQRIALGYLADGRLPWPNNSLPLPVVQALDAYRQTRNRQLEKDCQSALEPDGYVLIAGLRPNKARAHGIAHLSGEIDLLCIDPDRSRIWVIEAKDPYAPFSGRQIRKLLEDFNDPGKYVDKLLVKLNQIRAYASECANAHKIPDPDREWTTVGLMVTRRIEPAAFSIPPRVAFCEISNLAQVVSSSTLPGEGRADPSS